MAASLRSESKLWTPAHSLRVRVIVSTSFNVAFESVVPLIAALILGSGSAVQVVLAPPSSKHTDHAASRRFTIVSLANHLPFEFAQSHVSDSASLESADPRAHRLRTLVPPGLRRRQLRPR